MKRTTTRRDALRRYIVFRVKAIEFLDLVTLWRGLKMKEFFPYTPVGRTQNDIAWSMRTVALSWLALFVDKSKGALNVIELWRDLFPNYRAEIDQAWAL